ncbi:hypothetical protein [Spirochaeta cellobiosiphila]|uniref:hypothetical protein n=1 Tax=Spirochaeta cellobiosiphila TaxID=504483 RepID=UPI0003FB5A64|nr:hypothetical protein [Spirochaeta cellobiosiphila]
MSDTTWYRSSDWDRESQVLFYQKIKRARNSKIDYILIKSRVLYATNESEKMAGAKNLLKNAIEEYKDKQDKVIDLAQVLSRWYLQEKNFIAAEKYIDEYFSLSQTAYSLRRQKGSNPHEIKSELLLLKKDLEQNISAIKLINQWHKNRDMDNGNVEPFVPSYLRVESYSSIVIAELGIKTIGDAWDLFEIRHSDLDYNLIHNKNEKSLLYLWNYLREGSNLDEYRLSSYSWYNLREIEVDNQRKYLSEEGELFSYIIELGAYIGQTIIHESNGKWLLSDLIIKSRIIIHGDKINPFMIAYIIVVYRFPIKDVLERLDTLKTLCNIIYSQINLQGR